MYYFVLCGNKCLNTHHKMVRPVGGGEVRRSYLVDGVRYERFGAGGHQGGPSQLRHGRGHEP